MQCTSSPPEVWQMSQACCMQPVYGYGSRTPATFASAAGLQDTFFVEDPILDVKEVRERRMSRAVCPSARSKPMGPWRKSDWLHA